MRFHAAPLFALALLTACSAASNDDGASSSAPLTGGVSSTRPILQISVTGRAPCSGTLISDSWVLSTQLCVNGLDALSSIVVQAPPQLGGGSYSVSNVVGVSQNAIYGVLLHLATPITLSSYPAIARTPLGLGSTMTCASTNPAGAATDPVEAPFVVGLAINPSVGWWGVSPTTGASIGADYGDGCFDGNTMVALEGKGTGSVQDTSFIAPAIDAVFCGGARCGTVLEGSTTISCGTCDDGYQCLSGACVSTFHCPKGMVDCGGYCAFPKRCW